jgi:hypothetical protein
MAYKYVRNPHLGARKAAGPPTRAHVQPESLNDRIGLGITKRVGTMWCAYAFMVVALVSLPDVLDQAGFSIGFTLGSGTVIVVAWVAQTFIQLVLLSIIMVGQDLQGRAGDVRAEATYKDAEAVLQECIELQKHLEDQDKTLAELVASLSKPKA